MPVAKIIYALVSAWAISGTWAVAGDGRLVGKPEILSGDTLKISGATVRLTGVVAPVKGQSCRLANGRRYDCSLIAKTALMDLTAGVPVVYSIVGAAGESPPVALCTAEGYDLSKGMAHAGWALAMPRTGTVYAERERYARAQRHGLWKGRFAAPWDWRAGRRAESLGAGAR